VLFRSHLGPYDENSWIECMRLDDIRAGGNRNGILELSELDTGFANWFGTFCDCLEDITGDGFIDADDAMIVMDNFGVCDCEIDDCPGDVNQDRVVDNADLLQIMNAWGVCDH